MENILFQSIRFVFNSPVLDFFHCMCLIRFLPFKMLPLCIWYGRGIQYQILVLDFIHKIKIPLREVKNFTTYAVSILTLSIAGNFAITVHPYYIQTSSDTWTPLRAQLIIQRKIFRVIMHTLPQKCFVIRRHHPIYDPHIRLVTNIQNPGHIFLEVCNVLVQV